MFSNLWDDGLIVGKTPDERLQYVKSKLAADPNFVSAHDDSGSLLFHAVSDEDLDIVRYLLEHGADPNGLPTDDDSPLCVAAEKEQGQSILQLLLAAGADIERPGFLGTAFYTAMRAHQFANAELLLNAGANINCRHQGDGDTPLWSAAFFRDPAACEFLLSHGADPTIPDRTVGDTPLEACLQWPDSFERTATVAVLQRYLEQKR